MTRVRAILGLAVCLGASFSAALIGSLSTGSSITGWYAQLNKPAWTPPGWVFGPVWTALYLMMSLAAWTVWLRAGVSQKVVPLTLFAVQLALNAVWSPVFFGLRMPGPAFFVLAALWCAILATGVVFWRRVALAGILLLPYLIWSTFALALNFAIWRMNT